VQDGANKSQQTLLSARRRKLRIQMSLGA